MAPLTAAAVCINVTKDCHQTLTRLMPYLWVTLARKISQVLTRKTNWLQTHVQCFCHGQTWPESVHIKQVPYMINNTVVITTESHYSVRTDYRVHGRTNKATVLIGFSSWTNRVTDTVTPRWFPWRQSQRSGAGLLQTFIMYLQIKMAQTCAL